jgi:hypothetical protein
VAAEVFGLGKAGAGKQCKQYNKSKSRHGSGIKDEEDTKGAVGLGIGFWGGL